MKQHKRDLQQKSTPKLHSFSLPLPHQVPQFGRPQELEGEGYLVQAAGTSSCKQSHHDFDPFQQLVLKFSTIQT
jgi:hypothetical protein